MEQLPLTLMHLFVYSIRLIVVVLLSWFNPQAAIPVHLGLDFVQHVQVILLIQWSFLLVM